MKMRIVFLFLMISIGSSYSQETNDTIPYQLYKERVVLFSDLGFNSAPFSIKDNYNEGVKKLKFKHNLQLTMGLGIKYKWFGLRIGFGIPGNLRPDSRFGKSQLFNIGTSFSLKKTFWDAEWRYNEGFVIVNAKNWNDTLNDLSPHLFRPNTIAHSLSINGWYFRNDHFKMAAVFGKVGHYTKPEGTIYVKGTLNQFGINNKWDAITPEELIDTTQSKSLAQSINALDLGVVPGYAYVGRINNWQFSVFGGLGAVVQAKTYSFGTTTRGVLGLAPRIDLRLIAGYSKPDYFFWIVSDFDIKSIRFREMRYNQIYYQWKLVGGIRLKEKKKEKRLKD
ncbi:MAG: hypothetical protein CSA03_04560 [Bacteroidetes bacterium]|nr:MAG: hypothetical protein CSA03_04560 [Bacteroidota bacterium]